MAIWKVNAGFDVFENTWAKNAEEKCFPFWEKISNFYSVNKRTTHH